MTFRVIRTNLEVRADDFVRKYERNVNDLGTVNTVWKLSKIQQLNK